MASLGASVNGDTINGGKRTEERLLHKFVAKKKKFVAI